MKVRRATTSDFPQMEALLGEFMDESLKDFGAKIEKQALSRTMHELVNDCLVLEDGNSKVIGLIAGKIVSELAADVKIFQEVVWYVAKEHRRYGLMLIKEMEKWCKSRGVTAMVMVRMGNSMPEKVARFYERIGYRHMECHYLKRL